MAFTIIQRGKALLKATKPKKAPAPPQPSKPRSELLYGPVGWEFDANRKVARVIYGEVPRNEASALLKEHVRLQSK